MLLIKNITMKDKRIEEAEVQYIIIIVQEIKLIMT